MKILHHPSPDPQRGWSKKGVETTSKLRKENAERAPKDKGELLDEKVFDIFQEHKSGRRKLT